MTADPRRSEQVAEVLCRRDDSMYHHERTDDFPCSACRADAEALAAAGLTPQGTTVEEWRVTYDGNDYEDFFTTEEGARQFAANWKTSRVQRRTRTVFADRVSEWQPAPEEER